MIWVIVANALTIIALGALYFLANASGWQLCLAWLFGYFFCYIQFRCWRMDKDEPPLIRE